MSNCANLRFNSPCKNSHVFDPIPARRRPVPRNTYSSVVGADVFRAWVLVSKEVNFRRPANLPSLII